MKLPNFLFVILLLAHTCFGQQTESPDDALIDKKMMAVPESQTGTSADIAKYISSNFTLENEKVRAAFYWVAANMEYDIDNIYAINLNEKLEDREPRALQTRKGICYDYATLFTDVCNRCGLQSYVVTGYNWPAGMDGYLSHAWSIVLMDRDWLVFDPTWGAGYINNKKFVRRLDNKYYKMKPAESIKSHMPFDPMWECLNYPITNADFYSAHTDPDQSRPYFSYKDSIKAWALLSPIQQHIASARRIEQNGVKNSMTYDMLYHLKSAIKYSEDTVMSNTYDAAVAAYNNSINEFNRFIAYRNKQFKPAKTDPEIQLMIDSADNDFTKSRNLLNSINTDNPNNKTTINRLKNQMTEYEGQLKDQKEWLAKYFTKSKIGRHGMFYKYTWMGVPLN